MLTMEWEVQAELGQGRVYRLEVVGHRRLAC